MNILTFDIEEWWVYNNFSHYGDVNKAIPRLDNYLAKILDLLDENNTKATFFCLGYVAKKYPDVLRKIHKRGHSVGCHSYSHTYIENMSQNDFEEDTKKAIYEIENVIGEKVLSYRAPAFSITPNTKWAFEILNKYGIKYDSSIFPSHHRFGGFPGFKYNEPVKISYNGVEIYEFPIQLKSIFGKQMAFSGGGYFRLFPLLLINSFMRQNSYNMAYFHLRDIDTGILDNITRAKTNMSRINYFANFYGIKGAYSKLLKFIESNSFCSLHEAVDSINWNDVPVVKI